MDRIAKLKRNISLFLDEPFQRVIRSDAEWILYANLVKDSYSKSVGEPEILRKAAFMEAYAEGFPASIEAGQLLTGSRKIGQPGAKLSPEQYATSGFHGNQGHIIVDYGMILREGVSGLSARVEKLLTSSGEQQRINRSSYLRTLRAFSRFILRHAETAEKLAENEVCEKRKQELLDIARVCARISVSPAGSFHEALQLAWFTHVFLFAEGCASAFSFGRFDQFMWPYLKNDLESGAIDTCRAEELLSCFWFKCCEGCESQNLTVGGVDSGGRCAENPLSLLCLKVAADLGLHQPSVTVSVSPFSTEEFWEASLKLFSKGFGMPSFVNNEVVVKMLRTSGIPLERARDWGIVGCFEPTTQGDSGSFTVASGVSLIDLFRLFFDSDKQYADFAAFLTDFKDSLRTEFPALLRKWNERWQCIGKHYPSPFESVCLVGCIESGLAAEEGGSRYPFFGVDILGFGNVIDSLQAVREIVFRKHILSINELRKQVADNFPDESVRQACMNIDGRYGTDSPDSNELTEEL
ncbi:MAG: pyruvate formate lyase family protein, partial [Lentisphaerota bacterium]